MSSRLSISGGQQLGDQADGSGILARGVLAGPEREAPVRATAPGPLPCLYSNNSTEGGGVTWRILKGGHKRTAHVLATEIILLAKKFGIETLGFLTLTFPDHVTQLKEAQRRFNSLNTHVINARYSRAIGVWERHESGRIHFHLVVVLAVDIRSGFDFEAVERRDYRSANQALRAEWAFWRATAPKYHFGRTELLPVKSTAEGIARYVGKYVSKHIRARGRADLGARVVRFLGYGPGERSAGSQFAWNTDNGWLWRHKVKAWCEKRGLTFDDLQKIPRWAWRLKDSILTESVHECFPSEAIAHRSLTLQDQMWIARAQAMKILDSISFTKTYDVRKDFR